MERTNLRSFVGGASGWAVVPPTGGEVGWLTAVPSESTARASVFGEWGPAIRANYLPRTFFT
jgi:hypothetical protein